MKKSELKDGMKIILENGKEYIVTNDTTIWASYHDGFMRASQYDENLIHKGVVGDVKGWGWDVDEVLKFSDNYKWEIVSEPKIYLDTSYLEGGDVRFIFQGNKTTVILDDGYTATTKCLPEDKYNKEKGLKATMKRDVNILAELCK